MQVRHNVTLDEEVSRDKPSYHHHKNWPQKRNLSFVRINCQKLTLLSPSS